MKKLFCPYCGKYTSITSKGLFVRHGFRRSKKVRWLGGDSNQFKEYGIPCASSGKKC